MIEELLADYEPAQILLIGGALLGAVFGVVSQQSKFCFRAVIDDAVSHRIIGKAGIMYFAAMAMAILGTQIILQQFDISWAGTVYLQSSAALFATVLGGLMFGAGLILTGGCSARHVVLSAQGSFRSLWVLIIMALTAYATMRGILALIRTDIEAAAVISFDSENALAQTLPEIMSLGDYAGPAIGGIALIIVILLAVRRGLVRYLVPGVAIGGLIPVAWYITGVVGYDEFEPAAPQALSFVSPLGNGLQFLLTYTGSTANFAILFIGSVFAAAAVAALISGQWKFRGFEQERDILRYTAGATLMGAGGIMALGCTIGQGLSGVALLSFNSILAMLSVAAGAAVMQFLRNRQGSVRALAVAAE